MKPLMKPLFLAVLASTGILAAACGGSTGSAASTNKTTTTTKSSSASTAGASTASTSAAGGGSQGTPTKISVGIIGANTADWPLFMAEKEGFFQKAGLSVSTVVTGSPPNAVDQLASGSLNFASDGTDSWVRAVATNLPVQIVAPEMITDPYTLITRPNITSWSQLKGKTVILGTKTDVTAISFTAMAAAQHMSFNDFSYVTAGSTNARFAALKSGHVDAAMLTQPFDFLAESQGMHELATSYQYVPHWMFTAYAVNTKWEKNNGPVIVKFVKALEQGIQYAYAHPNAAISVMASTAHVPTAQAKQAYDLDFQQWKSFSKTETVSTANVQAVVNAVVKQGTVSKAPSLSALFNDSYVQQANNG